MDFAMSPRAAELQERLQTFVDECITPATPTYWSQIEESGDIRHYPAIMDELKAEAKAASRPDSAAVLANRMAGAGSAPTSRMASSSTWSSAGRRSIHGSLPACCASSATSSSP